MIKFFAAILFLTLSIMPAYADQDNARDAAKAFAQACSDAQREDFSSGITSKMRSAGANYAACIRDHIIDISKILFDDATQPEVEKNIIGIYDNTGRAYWQLYNEHQNCPCGSMYTLFHNTSTAQIMAEILADFYVTMESNGFPIPR